MSYRDEPSSDLAIRKIREYCGRGMSLRAAARHYQQLFGDDVLDDNSDSVDPEIVELQRIC